MRSRRRLAEFAAWVKIEAYQIEYSCLCYLHERWRLRRPMPTCVNSIKHGHLRRGLALLGTILINANPAEQHAEEPDKPATLLREEH